MSNLIFVYGTLRSTESRSSVLTNSKFIGEYKSLQKYTMVNLGNFPGIFDEGTTQIFGEVYSVENDVLETLDRIEGHPDFYQRKPILLSNFNKTVFAYFLEKDRYHSYPLIESGNWLLR